MENLLSSEHSKKSKEKSPIKTKKSPNSSSSSEQNIIVQSNPISNPDADNSSKSSSSSESSGSESSENEEAYVFRDSEYALPPIKVDEDPQKYLSDPKKKVEDPEVPEEEFTEVQIEDVYTKKIVPETLDSSSSDEVVEKEKKIVPEALDSSSSDEVVEKEKIVPEILDSSNSDEVEEKEKSVEVGREGKVMYKAVEVVENTEFERGFIEGRDENKKGRDGEKINNEKDDEEEEIVFSQVKKEISESSSSSSSSSSPEPPNPPSKFISKLSNDQPDPPLPSTTGEEFVKLEKNPSKPNPPFSSSSFEEPLEIRPLPSPSIEPEDHHKDHRFADISGIDIYGSTHFVNVNDRSDFSIEVSHNPIEFEEDGRKSSIRPKDQDLSGSEEDTLQELKVFEHALREKDQEESSDYSDKEKIAELDQAVVIDNSEIKVKDSSDSSDEDGEILKRIQNEPDFHQNQNFPVEKIEERRKEEVDSEDEKKELEAIPEEKEERRSSSSSHSISSGEGRMPSKKKHVDGNGVGKNEVQVEEVKVVDVKQNSVEEVKVVEDRGSGNGGTVVKQEVVYKKTEKDILQNSLVSEKLKEGDKKKKTRDQKGNAACSRCIVF